MARKVGSIFGALPPFGGRFPNICPQTVRTCLHVYGFPLITSIYFSLAFWIFALHVSHTTNVFLRFLSISFSHSFSPFKSVSLRT